MSTAEQLKSALESTKDAAVKEAIAQFNEISKQQLDELSKAFKESPENMLTHECKGKDCHICPVKQKIAAAGYERGLKDGYKLRGQIAK